jgi:mannitol/fructose-specific phosphotransferase system IIA component (Ntr-type)/CheY-like chemotaxis protein
VNASENNNDFALVPRQPGAIEKAEPGAKRVLPGMVADALALVKKQQRPKPRIVLVNDDAELLQLMESIICDEFTILKFQNGEQAWQELQRQDPDILVTDMERPNDSMDGWAMIPLLAEKKVKYPVVVVSSCGEFSSHSHFLETVGAEYAKLFEADSARFHSLLQHARRTLNIAAVAIPFENEELLRVLKACLEKTNVETSVAASHPVSILFSAEHIIPNLKAKERFAAIREMVARLISIGRIRLQDEGVVLDAITKRENQMSTGLGFGLATPRGRVDCVKNIVLAIGVSDSGVEFDALDNQLVNVIVMFIIPANSMPHNVKVMRFEAKFLQTFHKAHFFEQFFHSKSSEEMWSILKPVYDDVLAFQAES